MTVRLHRRVSILQPQNAFPLSPIQQGMLYHYLTSPNSGTDIEQMVVTLREPLETTPFRRAWQRLVDRHGAFRTGFEWEGLPSPEQREYPQASLPWVQKDIQRLSPE